MSVRFVLNQSITIVGEILIHLARKADDFKKVFKAQIIMNPIFS